MSEITICGEFGVICGEAPAVDLGSGVRPADLQEFLTVLARVQEQHMAGAFGAQPNVSMLMHRAVPVAMEIIRLRMRVGALEAEAALCAGHRDLFDEPNQPNS